MKAIIFALLLSPIISLCQDPPKKCSVIKVTPVSFRHAVNSLLDLGYSIEKIDSNFLTVRTEPKNYSKTKGGMVQIEIRVKDSSVIITGYCGLRNIDFEKKESNFFDGKYYYKVENRGMKGSLSKEAFDVMNEFAKGLSGKIEYL